MHDEVVMVTIKKQLVLFAAWGKKKGAFSCNNLTSGVGNFPNHFHL